MRPGEQLAIDCDDVASADEAAQLGGLRGAKLAPSSSLIANSLPPGTRLRRYEERPAVGAPHQLRETTPGPFAHKPHFGLRSCSLMLRGSLQLRP